MIEKLKKLNENSYSPYSKFRVSAIAVMKDGQEFGGRGTGFGLHLDAGLLEGHSARNQTRHRVRCVDCLHHVHRRLCYQLLYIRSYHTDSSRYHLFND